MSKAKKIIKNWRVIMVLLFLVFAYVAINGGIIPGLWREGVAIRTVAPNSSASNGGIESPQPNARPMSREVVLSINNMDVKNVNDYYEVTKDLKPNRTIQIKTDKQIYTLITKPVLNITILQEQEMIQSQEIILVNKTVDNGTVLVNETLNITKSVNKTYVDVIGTEDIGLGIYDAPKTNLKKGLDLQGGTRVLLKPEEKIDADEMSILIDNMKYRLNIYGLSDVIVREAGDLSGNQYVLVEAYQPIFVFYDYTVDFMVFSQFHHL